MKEVPVLTPTCKCGQAISFPEGKTKARCPVDGCGMQWESGPEGYWAIGLFTISFTPIFAREKLTHYEKVMRWRNKTKGRKAGRKC